MSSANCRANSHFQVGTSELNPIFRCPPFSQKCLEVCYCLWAFHSDPSLGPILGPSRSHPGSVRRGPVQIRHVLCFTAFRTHPGPEVGAIPAHPGPILLPSVPSRIGPGRPETDFLATSDLSGTEKGVITKGVFSLEESLESLKSLNSLESLENGRILLCFPQSGGSLKSLESLNSLESLENGLF